MMTPGIGRTLGRAAEAARQPRGPRGGQIALSVGTGVAAALVLVSLAWSPPGASPTHVECSVVGPVANVSSLYIPAVLVNSPYGGGAWGNGTFPATFPGIWNGPPPRGVKAVAYGTGALNGSAEGAFFTVNASINSVQNLTVPGPGPGSPCSLPYSVSLGSPPYYLEAGGGILPQNSTTDVGEPSTATIAGTHGVFSVASFNNSFTQSNELSLSTCGGAARSISLIESSYLDVSVPVLGPNGSQEYPYTIPVQETYHYFFPADFGTWQIDNLSAPGGPGGGWAFSYQPCA